MKHIQLCLMSVATFYLRHNVFFRVMILFAVFIDGMMASRRSELIVSTQHPTLVRTLTALLIASFPDAVVVAIGHPETRRSQLVLSAVIIMLVVCAFVFMGNRVGSPVIHTR